MRLLQQSFDRPQNDTDAHTIIKFKSTRLIKMNQMWIIHRIIW